MDPKDAQPGDPSAGPGLVTEKPQAVPAVERGPDSMSMPTMGEQLGRQRPGTDYEARYQGLNEWVSKEFNSLRSTVQQMGQQMSQLTQALQQPSEAQAPKKAPAPVSDGNQSKTAPVGPDPLDLAIQRKKAEQYRDLLLEETEKATGLPVTQFRKNIEVVPVALKENGELDDSGQRAVIEEFVNTLKGLKGDAQREVLQGYAPGSSPGGGRPDTAGDLVKELHDIMTLMGDGAWDELSASEQAKTESRYFELLEMPEVQERHEGALQPSMSVGELSKRVRDLTRTVTNLRGQLPASFG